jgi:pyridoxine 4-dehydrogenase
LDDLPEGDVRRYYPRFSPENFSINLQLVEALQRLAATKDCTPAQLAINWVSGQSKNPGMPPIIPLPGAVADTRARENARQLELTPADLKDISDLLAKFSVAGARYPESVPIDG